MRQSLGIAYTVLILAQAILAINVIASKHLVGYLPMFFVLAGRFTISTVLLAIIVFASRTPLCDPAHPKGKLTTTDWLLAILQGLFAGFLFNLFFAWGLQYTTATAAGIISSTLPVITAVSAIWFLKERLTLGVISALFLAMLGVAIINFNHLENASFTQTNLGDLLIFIAMFPEAWFTIISRKLRNRITPLGSALIANSVSMVTLIPCALVSGFDFAQVASFDWMLITLAGTCSLLFFWGWAWGLSFISASKAGITGGMMPVMVTLFANLFLGEILHWYDSTGMMLVILSIVIGSVPKPFWQTLFRQNNLP